MSKLSFEPVISKRQSEVVAQLIQDRVMAADVAVGDRLPSEQQLTEELNVSRSVVREALRILETSGLVRVRKGRRGGIFVAHGFHEPFRNSLIGLVNSGRATVEQVIALRLMLEPAAAAEACTLAGEEDLEALAKVVEDCRNHLGDAPRLRRNNLDFHLRLVEAAGNPILVMVVRSVLELLDRLVLTRLDLEMERSFVEIHADILAAVRAGRVERARRLVTNDILEVQRHLDRLFNNQPRTLES